MELEFASLKPAYKGSTVISEDPMVAYLDDFVTPDECKYIINLAREKLARAKVSMDNTSVVSPGRSGSNCWLAYGEDKTVDEIATRAANLIGIPLENAEAMQVVYYSESQEYRPHFDAYNLTSVRGQRCCKFGGQRLVTALAYLNEVSSGGATNFPKINATVDARPGRMAIFHNVTEDCLTPHPLSLHAGAPVLAGEKWALNMWFRARPMAEVQMFEQYPEIISEAVFSDPTRPQSRRSKSINRELTPGLSIIANRALPFVETSALQAWSVSSRSEPVSISYWDTFEEPHPISKNNNGKFYSLVDRKISSKLANRKQLFRKIADLDRASISPNIIFGQEDAKKIQKSIPTDDLWTLRNATGKASQPVVYAPLKHWIDLGIGKQEFLQQKIADVLELDGHALETRLYLMASRNKLFLYKDGLNTNDCGLQGQFSAGLYDRYDEFFDAARKTIRELAPIFSELVSATGDDSRYAVVSIDIVFTEEKRALVASISNMPNFFLNEELEDSLIFPLFFSMFEALIEGSSDNLLEILLH